MEPLSTSLVIAWLASQLQELLKKAAWFPFIGQGLQVANRVFAALLAAIATVGINVTNPEAGTWVVTGLTLGSVLTFIVQFLWQYIAQKVAWRVVVKPTNGG